MKRATLGLYSIEIVLCDFNPRPREEGDWWWDYTTTINYNFNPRPREEGDVQPTSANADYKISIHALVKRATALVNILVTLVGISIHALVKRATSSKR